MPADRIDTVVNLCQRRGFAYPCGEIYGGTWSAWDYGPLGVELKDNIKRQWWKAVVQGRDDVVGLDSSVIQPRQVWAASGHLSAFHDPLVECTSCHRRFHADHLAEGREPRAGQGHTGGDVTGAPCPNCGPRGRLTEPRAFNSMIKTHLGPAETEDSKAYLRPETAQGVFVNFLNVQTTSRRKPPFGIGQIGLSFRNEIAPGDFLFRTREFEQMELEFFVEPGSDEEWHQYWIDERLRWYTDLGIGVDNLRVRERPRDKLAHYSKRTVDIEYRFHLDGAEWGEVEGVANRTDFDLNAHSNHSGVDLSYFDQATNSRYRPFVIEPAAGVGRPLMAFLLDAYAEEVAANAKGGVDRRVVLRLDRRLAPVKVAVLPLSRSADLTPKGKDLAAALRRHWNIDFDDAGAIGRRYRRQDEIGTPFCVTVDFDTLNDHAVEVRERDTMVQQRVSLDRLESYLAAQLVGC
ncbi:glycine--tRNA ligase [Actinokineospora pegani]|uniref:glycine--tRNA ligase n=1 Tax=Actinokineospora pegani TaxID=2654637 RepID=UPI0012EA69B0|nr:glycine--tRNA ligase [Actinokineospora pegani]